MGAERRFVGTTSSGGTDFELFLEESEFRWYQADGARTEIMGYTIAQAKRKLMLGRGAGEWYRQCG